MRARERTDRWVAVLGFTLLAAYVVQARFELAWPWLARQQATDSYKALSGCVLAGYLLWQWRLRARRLADPVGAVRWHKLAGACAPLVLYLHAARLAYGYLLALAIGYLAVTGLGLLHRAALRGGRRLFTWWFVVHVAMSTMLLLVAAYHVVIALAYE